MIDFPPPEPGEPVKISAGFFRAWKRCPAQAAARFEGHYSAETPKSFLGSLCHRLFFRHLTSGPIPIQEIERACREEIGKSLNHKMTQAGITSPSLLRPVISEAADLYRRFTRIAEEGFEAAEVELRVEPVEGVELVGTIDAVFRPDGRLLLVDWKTGSLTEEATNQLGFYALLWVLARNELPAELEAVSVGTGERDRIRPELGQLEGIAAEVSNAVTTLRRSWKEGTALPLRAGPWCRYCPIVAGCREGSAALEVLSKGE